MPPTKSGKRGVQGSRFQVETFRLRVRGVEFRVWGLGLRVWGLGFRLSASVVQGLGPSRAHLISRSWLGG